jgi:hypothetical protein
VLIRRHFEVLFEGMQLFGYSFYGVCRMGFTLVPLLSGYVDVRASYRFDLVLSATEVFFGIAFPACFSWQGFLYFNGCFLTYFGLFPSHLIVCFFVAY